MSDKVSDAIPVRRVRLTDPSQLPADYGTTPGGTVFGTTPGGTRVIYDRDFILNCRNSPIARTPPNDLPKIPGFTSAPDANLKSQVNESPVNENRTAKGDDHAFEMDV